MQRGHWYRLSGDNPDLGLQATAQGTRYLEDGDPALDPAINAARDLRERLRRRLGRYPHTPWRGRSGFPAITEAWNGAVYASRYGDSGSMIVFGGGHDDYFGSDVHAFDLASRQWSRISDGYVSGERGAYGAGAVYPHAIYPDGSPLPPHTYDYVQYDPAGNDFILFKGQIELGPNVKAIAIPHLFNLDSLSWRRGPVRPDAILNAGGWTTWDPRRRVIWGNSGDAGGGNAFLGFYPDGANSDDTFGRWGELHPRLLPGMADHNTMQIDTRRDVIIVAAHGSGTLHALSPADPGHGLTRLSESGMKPKFLPYAALEFSPNLDSLIYYSACYGKRLYGVYPPANLDHKRLGEDPWRWICLTDPDCPLDPIADAAETTAHGKNPAHTFGRFRVASFSGRDVAILVRHVDSPVYAMALN
jgi:hypothetical protein